MNKDICPVHNNRSIAYVCTDPKQKHSLKCVTCIIKDNVSIKHLIPIIDIIESNDRTIFQNWPLQNDMNEIKEIENISAKNPTDENIKKQINIYFTELRDNINAVIDKLQKNMLMKADQLWNFNDNIINQYNQFSSKEQIKTLILDQDIPYDHKNNQLKEIITQIISNQKPYKEAIITSLENLKAQEETIDYETPKQIQQQVVNLLQGINFFLVDDLQDLYFENENMIDESANKNIAVILDLIGNKFNRCTPEFLTKIEQHLKKYPLIMNKLDVRDFPKNRINISSLDRLTEEDLEQIKDATKFFISKKCEIYVERDKEENRENEGIKQNQVDVLMKLAKNKFNYCSKEYLERLEAHLQRFKTFINIMDEGEVHENNFEVPNIDQLDDLDFNEITNIVTNLIRNRKEPRNNEGNRQNIKIDDLMRLMGNKTNQCSNDFLNQLANILQGVGRYIHSFETYQIHEKGKNQLTCFDNLSDSQINNISLLAQKIFELTHRHGNDYKSSTIPHPLIQKSSNMVSKCFLYNLSTSQIQLDQVNQILINYPIFDTIDLLLLSYRKISMPFIKTNLKNSQKLQIVGDESGYLISYLNTLKGQAVSEFPLDNNLAYIIRCTFNRPYDCDYICIGLIQENQRHTLHINKDGSSGFQSNRTLNQLCIKGEKLSCDRLKKSIKCLEFRICVCNNQFYFADYAEQYPRYNHINTTSHSKFDKNKSYCFGVYFKTPGNDWSVRFDNVMVLVDKSKLTVFE